MKTVFFILLLARLLLPNNVIANNHHNPWKIWKQNSTLRVSYRPAITVNKLNSTDLIEIKATAKVNSTLSGFLFFIQQVDNTPNWLVNAVTSKVIKQISANENVFFIEFFSLWPVKPRLLIAHSTYWQNDDLSVEIALSDEEGINNTKIASLLNDDTQRFLRIKTHSAHWRLTPQQFDPKPTQNLTQKITGQEKTSPLLFIEYTFVADGVGDTPQWLANHLALKSIWKSLNNIERQLPETKWQESSMKGIRELNPLH